MPSKDQPYVRGNPKENQQDHDRNRGRGPAQRSSHSWRQRFEIKFCVVQFAILRYVVISNNKLAGNVRYSLRSGKMAAMPRRARVVTWNGKDVPPELRELPAGRYVVEAVEEEAPALSPEEEAGIEAALESYRQGRVVDAKRAREIIDAALGR